MGSYQTFASVYDMYMDNVPYKLWSQHIIDILKQHDISDGLICELGCGTGKMTRLLCEAGYDMIGIDNSVEMLSIAMEHQLPESSILYLFQDMREFELYGTVQAVISVCDSMNYILSAEELLSVMQLVNNYLDPAGLFIFDMNTIYKYESLLADGTFAENREEGSFIWENEYDVNTMENRYELTLYIQSEDNLYERYYEEHIQKAYSKVMIENLLQKVGFELFSMIDANTNQEVTDKTERILYTALTTKK